MTAEILDALERCVDAGQLLRDPDMIAPFLNEIGGREQGAALAVARPNSTAQVAQLVAACGHYGLGIIPHGGNTGLTGAALPRDAQRHVVLSLGRMKAVRAFDAVSGFIIAEAGCVLAEIQEQAAEANLILPLGLGSEGSCTLGGIAATNAGGTRALRYGNSRDNILGLEVVLPDGQVFDGLRTLRKHNMGYDLKQIFIGSEGSLGVITAVAMRLSPAWGNVAATFVALPSIGASMDLLGRLRAGCGDNVIAFELIDRAAMELAAAALPATQLPVSLEHPAYALVEIAGNAADGDAARNLLEVLALALEQGIVRDAAIADNERQRRLFWSLREAIITGQRGAGASVKLDVSVPISRVAEFISKASQEAERLVPGARPVSFGHVGDGNIHFSVLQPISASGAAFMAHSAVLTRSAHDIALALGGSISAEHGVGHFKRDEFERVVEPVELDLMRRVKAAIDPQNIMNPGAILRTAPATLAGDLSVATG